MSKDFAAEIRFDNKRISKAFVSIIGIPYAALY